MYVARWYRKSKTCSGVIFKIPTHTRWFRDMDSMLEYKKGIESAKSSITDDISVETYKATFEPV